MKPIRVSIVACSCAAIIGAGIAAAPAADMGREFLDPGSGPSPSPGSSVQVFLGPVVTNIKGRFQVEISVVGDLVTDVRTIEAGTRVQESVEINTEAVPLLEERILTAQTWDVDYVSGASYTSPGIIESAKGAFEAASLL